MARSKTVAIAQAKARLPELVQRAARGEEIVIARNGEPQARLGGNARAAIADAREVYVSATSAWEIIIKPALTFAHAEAVARLPRHHGDPFDRIIIAAGRVEDLAIVTSDHAFDAYDVATIDARR